MNWINSSERLPMHGQEVLGWFENKLFTSSGRPKVLVFNDHLVRYFRCEDDGHYLPIIHITHWCEITQPEK